MIEKRLTNPMETSAQYPLIRSFGDRVFLAWQSMENVGETKKDIIVVGEIIDGDIKNTEKFVRAGEASRPYLLACEKSLYLAWSEACGDSWQAYIAEFDGTNWNNPRRIAENKCISDIKMTEFENSIYIFYSELNEKASAKCLKILENFETAEIEISDSDFDNFRPNPAVGGDGNLYVLYDGFSGSSYSLYIAVFDKKSGKFISNEISDKSGFNTSVSLAKSNSGVIAIWTVIGRNSQIKYIWSEIKFLDNKPISMGAKIDIDSNFWHLSASQSICGNYLTENYGRGIVLRKFTDGEYSAPFIVTPNILQKFSQRSSIAISQNKIYVAYQNAQGNGHTWTRNAHIMLAVIDEAEFASGIRTDFVFEKAEFNKAVAKEKNIARIPDGDLQEFNKNSLESHKNLNYYFGDIHGQSSLSDGLGEIDQYFYFNKNTALQDFSALSDHDAFPDVISPSEWELMISYSNYFNKKENFATLIGYEWTSNEFRYDYGHKNVYFKGDRGDFYPCTSRGGYTPDRLFETFKNTDCLIIPHHMGAVWSVVLASTDWEYHSTEKQRVCEVLSRHAIFETDHDYSPYTKNVDREEANSLRDVLKRGYRIGFLGGSDSHQMEAGIEGGVTCVLANDLNRSEIYDGIYNRSIYATTGARILVQFEINGNIFGSEIKINNGGKLNFKGRILGTSNLKSVSIISMDGILEEWKDISRQFDFDFDIIKEKSNYYYLRIEQEDEHLALISPIWVD